jgi:Zn-dependent metalloprotease
MPSRRMGATMTARWLGLSVSVAALTVPAMAPTGAATAQQPSAEQAPSGHQSTTLRATAAKAGAAAPCRTRQSRRPVQPPAHVEFHQVRHSLLGVHRWYQQVRGGHPVPGGWWGWHRNLTTHVITINNCRVTAGKLNTTTPRVAPTTALSAAAKAATPERTLGKQLVALPHNGDTRLAWAVTSANGSGARTSYVDAVTGRVLSTELISDFARSPKLTIGTARVFDPNPVVKLQDQSLRDKGDAADAVPPQAYSNRDLPRLIGEGHTLVGRWVRIVNKDRVTSPTATYKFNRHNDAFEQVMAYYSLDAEQAYLQSLGFTDANGESQKIAVDVFADDNSFYIPGVDRIEMGTGGVDDAEDPEVAWHEYGHAIQDDQVPHWGLTYQGGSIGEGFGDYMAATMSQPHDRDTKTTPAACVMDWDATSYSGTRPHCLRRTDSDKKWTGMAHRNGDVHVDGEIWSAALWDINQQLGRDEATTIVIEAQFWMTPKTNFQGASRALIDVATQLYPGDQTVVARALRSRGLYGR